MKRAKTPTFLLELPLHVDWNQEHHLRAHLEAARCLYNALLSEANKRLRCMRTDPVWAQARALPRSKKQERAQAFAALRKKYHFSEYDLHEYAKHARVSWIAEHNDATMAQTLHGPVGFWKSRPCRSASAQKSCLSSTRAAFPATGERKR